MRTMTTTAAEPKLTDDEFLALVAEEMDQSIGFDNDTELAENRERALEYLKGEVKDVKHLTNRSGAVSTDLADALETIKPDLMEVLAGGDDIATFRPLGEEDEDAAAQETDYVNHVLMNENDGWRVIYTIVHDALVSKIGVAKVWGETSDEVKEESFTGQTAMAVQVAEMQAQMVGGEITDLVAGDPDPQSGEALWSFKMTSKTPKGSTKVMNVPPEDFTVAKDAVLIPNTTYCAMRTRPRAQELIADGYNRDDVENLPAYGVIDGEAVARARDTAGENDETTTLVTGRFNLHQVEIVEHYLRVDADEDGTPELWCIVTDIACRTLLKKDRVDRIPFSVSTPFIVTHRLYGLSLADKIFEVQRIKTLLLRMLLDSGSFALNQRNEVAMDRATTDTLGDLLNNTPGRPVRSKTGDAVRALGGGSLSFDVFGAMEYMSTVSEARTGIVRNAQGLNPDTLHETARGAQFLHAAAQKRVRMIARVFAETGLKDLFLLIHAVSRTMPKPGAMVRLRGKWVQVDPTEWGDRNDMSIEVGVGSGGAEQEIQALERVIDAQEKLVALQDGETNGPWITADNLFNTAKRLIERVGLRNPERYVSDPKLSEAAKGPPPPPPPDPAMVKVKAEIDLARWEAEERFKLERAQMNAEFALKRQQMNMEARLKLLGDAGGDGGLGDVRFGGEMG